MILFLLHSLGSIMFIISLYPNFTLNNPKQICLKSLTTSVFLCEDVFRLLVYFVIQIPPLIHKFSSSFVVFGFFFVEFGWKVYKQNNIVSGLLSSLFLICEPFSMFFVLFIFVFENKIETTYCKREQNWYG